MQVKVLHSLLVWSTAHLRAPLWWSWRFPFTNLISSLELRISLIYLAAGWVLCRSQLRCHPWRNVSGHQVLCCLYHSQNCSATFLNFAFLITLRYIRIDLTYVCVILSLQTPETMSVTYHSTFSAKTGPETKKASVKICWLSPHVLCLRGPKKLKYLCKAFQGGVA